MALNTYFWEDLVNLPTLARGHTANLKLDTGTTRVWVSRMSIADGETQPVQVEKLVNGLWTDVTKAEGQYGSFNDVALDGKYEGFRVRCLTRTLVQR